MTHIFQTIIETLNVVGALIGLPINKDKNGKIVIGNNTPVPKKLFFILLIIPVIIIGLYYIYKQKF